MDNHEEEVHGAEISKGTQSQGGEICSRVPGRILKKEWVSTRPRRTRKSSPSRGKAQTKALQSVIWEGKEAIEAVEGVHRLGRFGPFSQEWTGWGIFGKLKNADGKFLFACWKYHSGLWWGKDCRGRGAAGTPWRGQFPICHPDQGWEWLGLARWGRSWRELRVSRSHWEVRSSRPGPRLWRGWMSASELRRKTPGICVAGGVFPCDTGLWRSTRLWTRRAVCWVCWGWSHLNFWVLEPRGKLRLEMGIGKASGASRGAGGVEAAQEMLILRDRAWKAWAEGHAQQSTSA